MYMLLSTGTPSGAERYGIKGVCFCESSVLLIAKRLAMYFQCISKLTRFVVNAIYCSRERGAGILSRF